MSTYGKRLHEIYRKEYRAWSSMRSRCLNPASKSYDRYGGRGITVSDKWGTFEQFIADVGPCPAKELSLERVNNNLGYEPGNVVWADSKVQANNRRSSLYIEFRGRTLTLAQWAELLGADYEVLRHRIKYRGWSVEKAFTEPVRPRNVKGCPIIVELNKIEQEASSDRK